MLGAFGRPIGQFYQVAVGITTVERADRALGAAARHRAGDDLYAAGLEVGRHVRQ